MSKVTRAAVFLLGVSAVAGLTSVAGYKYGRCRARCELAAQPVAPAPAPGWDEPPARPTPPPAPAPVTPKPATPVAAPTLVNVAATTPEKKDLRLYLPRAIYATPGVEVSVFFDNLVDCDDINRLRFNVKCPLGASERRRWKLTPTDENAGVYPLEVQVNDSKGNALASASTTLKISPRQAGAGKGLRLLIVGDSLTHASHYPTEIARLLSLPGNPKLQLIGTHSADGLVSKLPQKPDVVHEGYSGWSWHDFLHHFDPGSGKLRYRDNSPFLYKDQDGNIALDVDRYLRETSPEGPPDVVIFQVGINDVYIQDPETITGNARKLVAAFRKAAPRASLGIWLTQPVNCSDETFLYVYKGGPIFKGTAKRSTIKTRQHTLAQALERTFVAREAEGIFILPMNLSLDPIDDYPVWDAVHPTVAGYQRLGQTVYAWMKWWLAHEEWAKGLGEAK